MFKSIKEFFVGKPKVEEPGVLTPVETVTPVQPVVEEIKPETVTISISDNMNVSVGSQSDTITFPPADSGAWPFPTTPPLKLKLRKNVPLLLVRNQLLPLQQLKLNHVRKNKWRNQCQKLIWKPKPEYQYLKHK